MVVMTIAGLLIGIGLNGFIIPHYLLDGGVVGISLLISYLWGLKASFVFLFINLVIYLFAFKFERLYFFYGVWGVVMTSLMIDLLAPLNGKIHLPVAASSVTGGVLIGAGVGLLIRNQISHDGVDLLALWLSKYVSLNTAIIIFIIDVLVIGSGVVIFRNEAQLYSFLTVICVAVMTFLFTLIRSISID